MDTKTETPKGQETKTQLTHAHLKLIQVNQLKYVEPQGSLAVSHPNPFPNTSHPCSHPVVGPPAAFAT